MNKSKFLEDLLTLLPAELHAVAREASASPSTAITNRATNTATNRAPQSSFLAALTQPQKAAPQQLQISGFHNPITGQDMILPTPERIAYFTLGRNFFRDLAPIEVREIQIVQQLVDLTWRLNRFGSIGNNLMVSEMAEASRKWDHCDPRSRGAVAPSTVWRKDCSGPQSFSRLTLVEGGIRRQLLDLGNQFIQLSTLRKNSARQPDSCGGDSTVPLAWYEASLAGLAAEAPLALQSTNERKETT